MSDGKIVLDSELEGVVGGAGETEGKRRFEYTVVSGDTLWDLSRVWGCTVEDIVKWNQPLIQNPDHIEIGWTLFFWK